MGRVQNIITKKVLKARVNDMGYYYHTLCNNGEVQRHYIHRLIGSAFIPNPDNKCLVDHINNTGDNRACNLRWATRSENGINKSIQKNNTSGHQGISWHETMKKWRTRMKVNGK